jgi:signal transduction histidine kinase
VGISVFSLLALAITVPASLTGRVLGPVLRGHRLEAVWVGFALANLAAMATIIHTRHFQGWETVPFHFIYVSFTLLYGFRAWQRRGTVAGIAFVTITTGAATVWGVVAHWESLPEVTEVPLMTLMFLAMVYHVRRRQEATAIAQRHATERQAALDRQHEFVANASHELRTPITIARGHLDVLSEHERPRSPEAAEAFAVVRGELDRMSGLIERLLRLAIASADRVAPVECDARLMVETVFRRWEKTPGCDWRLGAVASGEIALDADQIVLALDTVIENAVRYGGEGVRIDVGSRALPGGLLALTVADNGPGIPAEALAHAFDRFHRVERSRNRKSGGSGLGLAIVRAVAEAHGGTAAIGSGAGGGVLVTVTLPGLRSDGAQPVPAAADGLDAEVGLQLSP